MVHSRHRVVGAVEDLVNAVGAFDAFAAVAIAYYQSPEIVAMVNEPVEVIGYYYYYYHSNVDVDLPLQQKIVVDHRPAAVAAGRSYPDLMAMDYCRTTMTTTATTKISQQTLTISKRNLFNEISRKTFLFRSNI